jgi:hypothetical protein
LYFVKKSPYSARKMGEKLEGWMEAAHSALEKGLLISLWDAVRDPSRAARMTVYLPFIRRNTAMRECSPASQRK